MHAAKWRMHKLKLPDKGGESPKKAAIRIILPLLLLNVVLQMACDSCREVIKLFNQN